MLLFDILIDLFAKPQDSTLILTDSGWPMTLTKKYFMVHTPWITTARDFTTDFHEVVYGYQSHGNTTIRVKKPYVCQMLFFYLRNEKRNHVLGQKILRVYNEKLIRGLHPNHFQKILNLKKGLLLTELIFFPEIDDAENSKNLTLALILSHCLSQNSWTIKKELFEKTLNIVLGDRLYEGSIIDLHYSGIIRHNGYTVTVNTPGIVFLMETLHRRFPLRTEFDKDGILRLV